MTVIVSGCSPKEAEVSHVKIIPQPLKLEENEGHYLLSGKTKIISKVNTIGEAKYLSLLFRNAFGKELDILPIGDNGIILNLNPDLKPKLSDEGYLFKSSSKNIEIEAATKAGIFYGIQTLRQLLPPDFESAVNPVKEIGIKAVTIMDKPRFVWRAFMLDEARHFKGKEVVKKLLDQMALHKMNIFHWHLVDDQGWRIEIKKYPKLTEIGSKRKNSMINGWKSNEFSGKPHEGFYTQNDIREIVNYAATRHINIVPEIEMPGHSAAAIASYPYLGTKGEKIDVPVTFGEKYDIYDVTKPEVITFLEDVLLEVMDMFPYKVIHIGGDEVDYKIWKNSEWVRKYMQKNNINSPAELQIFFTNNISNFIKEHGRRMMGWNEILGGVKLHEYQDAADIKSDKKLAAGSIVHFWKGDISLINKAVSEGYDIVNSLHSSTYLDYDYKSISLKKAYSFDPVPEKLDTAYSKKVLGLGCQMWGEWIPTVEDMEVMVFPRFSAYAETGWSSNRVKDFKSFKDRLQTMKKRWDNLGIKYAKEELSN